MSKNVEDILSDENYDKNNTNQHSNHEQEKLAAHLLNIIKNPVSSELNEEEKKRIWKRILQSNSKHFKVKTLTKRNWIYSVAAAIVLMILSYGIWSNYSYKQDSSLINMAAQKRHLLKTIEKVEITSRNSSIKFDSDSTILFNALDLNHTGDETQSFSTLTVPYGQRSEIVLSDGSKIWMNSGSQLTFPNQFSNDKREVYLEGEAFFDIAHNPDKPFIVQSENMNIKVLGTTFNLSSYQEDSYNSIFLLSGKIELTSSSNRVFKKQILHPGTEAKLSKSNNQLSIGSNPELIDVLWTKKQLLLKNTPLPDLLQKLIRVYNTDIIQDFKINEDESFSGRLNLNDSLSTVLGYIYDPNKFTIKHTEGRITVQKK
ncbi:FecR domain-containing protein [Sphingobacterium sp. JB170]|uniref:FecR domain-containing protein n=1 Tax=Sphingobacterium sp. JB170 TaxID=1434842 RepID=UPI00097F69C5|nr:FecR domain-containing protein [Sphingobacterium sp. JB170]SJN18386.1 putative anti-sigma factor [Sphingobacterium sp. JB170]